MPTGKDPNHPVPDDPLHLFCDEGNSYLFHGMPFGIVIHDEDGSILSANPAAEEILGLSVNQMKGRTSIDPMWQVIHEDGSPFPGETHPAMETLGTGQAVLNKVMGVFHPIEGKTRWIHVSSIPFIRPDEVKPSRVIASFVDITDRVEAEQAQQKAEALFRESEERLHFALETIHAGAWDLNLVDQTAHRSIEHDRIFGYEDLLPQWSYDLFLDHVLPEDRGEVDQHFRAAIESGGDWNFECQIRRADGEIRWISAAGRHCQDKGGGQLCMRGVVQDITERKQAEGELQHTHDLLLQAERIAHLGSFEYVAATQITLWSDEECRIYGLDPAKKSPAYGEMLAKCIHPDDAALLHETFTRAIQSHSVYELEHRVVRPDGSVRWVHDLAHPNLNEQGELVRYVGVTLDITERKQADDALLSQQEMLSRTEAIAHVGSWVLDLVTSSLTWSDEVYRIFGETPQTYPATYEAFLQKVHPEDRAALNTAYSDSVQQGKDFWEIEHRIIRKATAEIRFVHEKCIHLRDESGVVIKSIGMVQDITERKQVELEVHRSHSLLSNLASLVPGVVYQYRLFPDGRSAFPYSSQGMNDIYEVTPEEVRIDATPVFGRLHPDDYESVAEAIKHSALTLEEFYCEFRVILPRQGLRWRWSQAHPQRMEDGGTLWHGIILDVTDRKQLEQARQESEARFTSI